MADSLSGNGIAVAYDVEAQRVQQSPWLCEVEETLRLMKEQVPNEMGFHVLKLAEYSRQPPAEYNPVAFRYGLHNRDNLGIVGSEAFKLSFVVEFGLEDPSDWNHFCTTVVPDPKSMLECYGLHREVSNLSEKEIQQVLALDALFLAVFVDTQMDAEDKRLWTPGCLKERTLQIFYRTFNRWKISIYPDLCKSENQIPFILIKRAIKHINNSLLNLEYDANEGEVHEDCLDQPTELAAKVGSKKRAVEYIKKCAIPKREDGDHPVSGAEGRQVPDEPYLEKWMKIAAGIGVSQFMKISDEFYKNANGHPRLSKSHHILDAAYKAICGVNGMERTCDRTQDDYVHIPSATKLRESGIKIKGVVGPLCTMSYDKKRKCLFLPKMRMTDETVVVVRNMARYEEYSNGNKCVLHDYVLLMHDLIQTPKDIEILTERGVIKNGCGNRAFEMWKPLDYGLVAIPSSKEHNEMKNAIKSRCKLKRHRFWSEFRTLFLSRPWLTLSAIAVVLVTVATLIQTYAAVIGSNGMKPQYKP